MPRTSRTPLPEKKTTAPRKNAAPKFSAEYQEYLERYSELGDERPKLTPDEYDQLDDELLSLLDLAERGLSDEQLVRLQELEYLLIDSE